MSEATYLPLIVMICQGFTFLTPKARAASALSTEFELCRVRHLLRLSLGSPIVAVPRFGLLVWGLGRLPRHSEACGLSVQPAAATDPPSLSAVQCRHSRNVLASCCCFSLWIYERRSSSRSPCAVEWQACLFCSDPRDCEGPAQRHRTFGGPHSSPCLLASARSLLRCSRSLGISDLSSCLSCILSRRLSSGETGPDSVAWLRWLCSVAVLSTWDL